MPSQYYTRLGVSNAALDIFRVANRDAAADFAVSRDIAEENSLKVICAMRRHKLAEAHFGGSTGYGYNDGGREALEKIYADVFAAEAALTRPQLISGTHALAVALSALLPPGGELVSVVGAPYDTLLGVIGARPAKGSLISRGVTYKEAALDFGGRDDKSGKPDYKSIGETISKTTTVALIQRSKGYCWRKSLSIDDIAGIVRLIKSINPNTICLVDNCYGEFVETREPIEAGADIVVGSLIKNPGGGLAPCGGYICGKAEYIEECAARLTAPGLGAEVGPTLGLTGRLAQGLFMAPSVVSSAVKGAITIGYMFENMDFAVNPKPYEKRADIVQAVRLGDPALIEAFCEGIQSAAAVDSFAKPEPWDMPGYDCPVLMAAGAFVQGASIELSADAPMRKPFDVFAQGGLTEPHAKLGALLAATYVLERKG